MELNRLTQDLYAEGYTREQHPNFVYWSNWQNFGYRWEALLKFTWETPCGLLIRGDSDLGRGLAAGDAAYGGICYCPENDNPLLLCPYEKKACPHIPQGFPRPFCPCRCTGRLYDYECSAEKVEAERAREIHRQYMELTGGPAVPVLWEAMAIRAGAWKSGMMWNSASGAAVRTRFA